MTPMRHLPPLAALRAFEAAARHLSFKRAAAELAVTPTAISHQIRLLEDQIGLKLFERRPRLLLLTPEGQRLYPVLRDRFRRIRQGGGELEHATVANRGDALCDTRFYLALARAAYDFLCRCPS